MTTSQTGRPSLKSRLSSFEQTIDDYINRFLPPQKPPDDIDKILSMSNDELARLSSEACMEYAVILAKYALYLQREINRHKSRLIWAEHNLNALIASEYDNYADDKFVKYDLVKSRICTSVDAARELNNMILHARCRIQELDQLSYKVSLISKTISSLGYEKNARDRY